MEKRREVACKLSIYKCSYVINLKTAELSTSKYKFITKSYRVNKVGVSSTDENKINKITKRIYHLKAKT